MLASSSSGSRPDRVDGEHVGHGAVAEGGGIGGPTRAVAPPKFQIDDSVLGDGGAALPARIGSIRSHREACSDSGSSSSNGAGRTGSRRRTASARRSSPSGPRNRRPVGPAPATAAAAFALPGVAGIDRGHGIDALAPGGLGIGGIVGDGREFDERSDVVILVARESRARSGWVRCPPRSDRSARRTSPSDRRDGARTRTPVTTPKLPPPPLSAQAGRRSPRRWHGRGARPP